MVCIWRSDFGNYFQMNQRRIKLLQEAVAMILASDDLATAADIAAKANAEIKALMDADPSPNSTPSTKA